MSDVMRLGLNWKPRDVVAVVVIIGGMALMALHIDTVVGAAVTLVTAYYFGRRKDNEDAKK